MLSPVKRPGSAALVSPGFRRALLRAVPVSLVLWAAVYLVARHLI